MLQKKKMNTEPELAVTQVARTCSTESMTVASTRVENLPQGGSSTLKLYPGLLWNFSYNTHGRTCVPVWMRLFA